MTFSIAFSTLKSVLEVRSPAEPYLRKGWETVGKSVERPVGSDGGASIVCRHNMAQLFAMALKTMEVYQATTGRDGLTATRTMFNAFRMCFSLGDIFVPKDETAGDVNPEGMAAMEYLGDKIPLLLEKWWRRYKILTPSLAREGILADFVSTPVGIFYDSANHARLRTDGTGWWCVSQHQCTRTFTNLSWTVGCVSKQVMDDYAGLHELLFVYGFFAEDGDVYENAYLAIIFSTIRIIRRERGIVADLIEAKPQAIGNRLLEMLKGENLYDKW